MSDAEHSTMEDTLTSIRSAGRPRNWMHDWLHAQPDTSPEPNETLSDSNDNDQDFAARLYSLCLRLLRYLCQQEQNITSERHRVSSLKEELGRLYLWGEAFGNGKLDRALGYSDDVRGNVLDSLRDIAKLLLRELRQSSTSMLPPITLQKSIRELKSLVEQTKVIISSRNIAAAPNGSDFADEPDTDQDDSSDDDDSTTIAEELRLQTQWLMQLGPVLEQNLVSAQRARTQVSLPEPVSFSVSGPAKIYVSLVREKYKQAPNQLVERLGEANWQRHMSVRNSMKASSNVAEDISAPVEDLAVSRSLFKPYSTFHDSGIGPSIPAQTEYAPSHTSFQSSNTEGGREGTRVPATPVEVNDGKPFECFLCKCVLSNIRNRVDWKVHIFTDLQPYICTFADCEDELAQFPNRAAWAEHEFSQHRITRSWSCPECPQAFTSVAGWQSHIQNRHSLVFSGPHFNVAKDMACKTEATRIEDDECPLCRTVVGKPRRAFVKHVARHMEEIALMALPRNVEEDSGEGSISTDRTTLEEGSTISQAKPGLETDVIAGEAEPRPSGSIAPFACEECDQKFFRRQELNAHNKVHTWPFRCVVPGCNFPGGRQRKDLDAHVREEHGKMVAFESKPASPAKPIKAPPTIRFHTTDQLNHEQDEFIPRDYDESGEKKVSPLGELRGGRVYNIRTFSIAHRGKKQFMLATECARTLGYRDSYLLFNKNRSLHKIIATPQEKEDFITQEIIPYSFRSRQIAIVTAKSMFRQFGARVIRGGRRVRDDYWEAEAIKQGFTEEDMPGDKRAKVSEFTSSPGAAYPSSANNSALQDYQMQMLLVEQQNKKRLLMARQEKGTVSTENASADTPAMPHATPVVGHSTPRTNQRSPPMTTNPIMNDITNQDIIEHPQYTSQQMNEIMMRREIQRRQTEFNAQNSQRMQNGSPNPQMSPDGRPPMQNLHQIPQQNQHQGRNDYMVALQRHQQAQMQNANMPVGGPVGQHPQHPRPPQQIPNQQPQPQRVPGPNPQQKEQMHNYIQMAYQRNMQTLVAHHNGNSNAISPQEQMQAKNAAIKKGQEHFAQQQALVRHQQGHVEMQTS